MILIPKFEANKNNPWISCLDVLWFPSFGLLRLFWLLDLSCADTSFLSYSCLWSLYANLGLYSGMECDISSSKALSHLLTAPLFKRMLAIILASYPSGTIMSGDTIWPLPKSLNLWNITIYIYMYIYRIIKEYLYTGLYSTWDSLIVTRTYAIVREN